MANWHMFLIQGCRKQSSDGQAQLNAGSEDTINSRSQSAPLFFFSSQEALSLHFSFKLGVTITLLSCLARNFKFDKILRKHTIFCSILFFIALQPRPNLYHVGSKA